MRLAHGVVQMMIILTIRVVGGMAMKVMSIIAGHGEAAATAISMHLVRGGDLVSHILTIAAAGVIKAYKLN